MNKYSRALLSSLSFLLALAIAWYMYSLYQDQKLWGFWSVPMYLFVVLGFLFARLSPLYLKAGKGKLLLASLLSGLLFWLGFPPHAFIPVLFVAFIPLLWIEQEIRTNFVNKTGALYFRYTFTAFFIWNILSTYWVTNTAFIAGIIALTANSCLMSIPLILYHHSRKYFKSTLAPLVFASLWISFEFLHMRWELSWPWLTIGNAFAEYPIIVQWYSVLGVLGGSLWVVALNWLVWSLKGQHFHAKNMRLAVVFLLLLIPPIASFIIYQNTEDLGTPTEVAIVQPNYEPHFQKFSVKSSDQLEHFVELSSSVLNRSTDFLLFPETVFNGLDTTRMNQHPAVRRFKELLQNFPNTHLITGVSAYRRFKEGQEMGKATRTHTSPSGKITYYEPYNAAIQISPDRANIPIYLKSKLVPGAESFPYQKVLFFVKPIIDALDGSYGLGTQPERTVFRNKNGHVAPVICYESVYGDYVTDYIRKGAELIFIGTNDGWWDKTAGHKQHLHFARLRAIETRRSIARAANTGISAYINQRGDLIQTTRYNEPIAISEVIKRNNKITFYVKWGDILGRLATIAAAFIILNLISKRLITQNRSTIGDASKI